ncbi:hypothetical protein [Streptomyces sp. NPDC001404]|uniref:hypothetical protein n=1 Tax=Streptomyces sp. NPDC001404 TaxID=3364571 RepID=UPI0036B01F99
MRYDEDDPPRAAEDEHTAEDFAHLADFLYARTDPLLLARPLGGGLDPALQALNDVIRTLLGQALAFREWHNEPALAGTWDALLTLAQPWRDDPGFHPAWQLEADA